MSEDRTSGGASALPPLCYIRHPATGETVEIRSGEEGWHPAGSRCSPECLNAKLAHLPTEDEISAMRHGSLFGWDTPDADSAMWRRRRESER